MRRIFATEMAVREELRALPEQGKEICQQIKDGIDAARENGVRCGYPNGVWINDVFHPWGSQ